MRAVFAYRVDQQLTTHSICRCTRSCYQCPNCIAPLSASSTVQTNADANLLGAESNPAASQGPYTLTCAYCNWTSAEVGIEFERQSGLASQLAKIQNGGRPKLTAKDIKDRRSKNPDEPMFPDEQLDADMQFANLREFYQGQLGDPKSAIGGMSLGDTTGFSSPAALSRIMSLYTGRGHQGDRAQHGPADTMRESRNTEEGLKMAQLDESAAIKKLMSSEWDVVLSDEQRTSQVDRGARFQDELRPIPYLLRTKRSKRCPVCRHIITKPEGKVGSTRFKIRLVAKSYIPTISIRPLHPTAQPVPVTSRPMVPVEDLLKPLKTYQYIVTFKNPLFENVKVTLAAPNKTPGRFCSAVTVLCPQFEIEANIDMWDDALRDDAADKKKGDESNGQAAAGKVWERGRNWVSIIVEVVPPSLRTEHLDLTVAPGETVDKSPLKDGEDLLEIPMFVRLEWEADAQHEVGSAPGKDKEAREKRELAYWCVLGVGRISRE